MRAVAVLAIEGAISLLKERILVFQLGAAAVRP
jgi:hypothetical protein